MFKLLSKESNIFSIPGYIGFLLLIVVAFSAPGFRLEHVFSAVITFAGVALGYFTFNQIGLNYQMHLPLFLYTFFVVAFYNGGLDIGVAVALLTNSFLLLLFTSTDDALRNRNYVLVGSILALNFIFLPTTWPMAIFSVLHITATSSRIPLNIMRLLFGMSVIFLAYFCVMYFLGFTAPDPAYLARPSSKFIREFYPLQFLVPVLVLTLYAVLDHFRHFNEKSPVSRYKFTFILTFTVAQFCTIFLYMGHHFEYLLLLALPVSIILSRMLYFLPAYWMRELGLWLIIFCLLLFRVGNFFQLL